MVGFDGDDVEVVLEDAIEGGMGSSSCIPLGEAYFIPASKMAKTSFACICLSQAGGGPACRGTKFDDEDDDDDDDDEENVDEEDDGG